jgi:broad specificity phosphatase PhoE
MKSIELKYFRKLIDELTNVANLCEFNFVRHSATELNKSQIVQGGNITRDQSIYPISEEDKEKCKRILQCNNFEAAYISSAKRTEETCTLITDAKKKVIPELDEINWGDEIDGRKKGRSYDILNEIWIESNIFYDSKSYNGESMIEFLERMCIAIEKICKDIVKYKYKSIVIVGHGFFFGILFSLLYDQEISLKQKLKNLEHRQLTFNT